MGHAISGVILNGTFDQEIASAYDLSPTRLTDTLTLFHLDHYFSACWSKMLGISAEALPDQPTHMIKGMVMFPCDRVLAHLMQRITHRDDPLFAVIETNYFGGMGTQHALVFQGIQSVPDPTKSVNSALRLLGVKADPNRDEFDTVGLGKHRSNPDFLEKYSTLAEELDV